MQWFVSLGVTNVSHVELLLEHSWFIPCFQHHSDLHSMIANYLRLIGHKMLGTKVRKSVVIQMLKTLEIKKFQWRNFNSRV